MTNTVLGPILGAALHSGTQLFNARELARTRPRLTSAQRAAPKLDAALEKRIDDIKPGASLGVYDIGFNKPGLPGDEIQAIQNVMKSGTTYAGSTAPGKSPKININPNADRAILAHEMGHLASQQTDIGNLVATLRHNPKLKNALLGAMVTVPGVAAAIEAGDDDLDTSIAMAALASAPTLVDEGLATKNGLAIMDMAGQRATLGQRGKLAGGFLSYLAPAILAGTAGNAVGNMLDSDY